MNKDEKIRYSRMLSMPEISESDIDKLSCSKVLVIGAGALGSLCSMYLAGAGVGHISIAEFDTIDISNLQRQLFYETAQAGQSKLDVITARLVALNPLIEIDRIPKMITEKLAGEIFQNYDFIVDATDNASSKSMTDKVAQKVGSYYCIAGVVGFRGQVMSSGPGHISYSDVFAPEGVCSGVMPCSVQGVLGPAAGVVACIQASETIKHLTGVGEMLYDRVFSIDLATMNSQTFGLSK